MYNRLFFYGTFYEPSMYVRISILHIQKPASEQEKEKKKKPTNQTKRSEANEPLEANPN
jgi:hypothetical protein